MRIHWIPFNSIRNRMGSSGFEWVRVKFNRSELSSLLSRVSLSTFDTCLFLEDETPEGFKIETDLCCDGESSSELEISLHWILLISFEIFASSMDEEGAWDEGNKNKSWQGGSTWWDSGQILTTLCGFGPSVGQESQSNFVHELFMNCSCIVHNPTEAWLSRPERETTKRR